VGASAIADVPASSPPPADDLPTDSRRPVDDLSTASPGAVSVFESATLLQGVKTGDPALRLGRSHWPTANGRPPLSRRGRGAGGEGAPPGRARTWERARYAHRTRRNAHLRKKRNSRLRVLRVANGQRQTATRRRVHAHVRIRAQCVRSQCADRAHPCAFVRKKNVLVAHACARNAARRDHSLPVAARFRFVVAPSPAGSGEGGGEGWMALMRTKRPLRSPATRPNPKSQIQNPKSPTLPRASLAATASPRRSPW
jgi:hypothetical protein